MTPQEIEKLVEEFCKRDIDELHHYHNYKLEVSGKIQHIKNLKWFRDIISHAESYGRREERERVRGIIGGMFSVYPTDTIHDFGPEEELISSKQLLSRLEEGEKKYQNDTLS